MRITAPQGSSLYEEQMEEIERQAAGQPGPMAMANIAAPMPQMQQPAIAPPTQQDPSLGSQAKEMVVDKAIGAGMDKVMDTAAGAALGKMGAAFGPMGMIAGEVAGQFLPQLLKRGLGFSAGGEVASLKEYLKELYASADYGEGWANDEIESVLIRIKELEAKGYNDGGHVGPLGAKYYSVGTPSLFGDAYADPNKAASASTSAAYQGAPMQNAVTELGKIERPTVGPNTGGGGFGGFLSGLFNSPVFAPLSNLVSGVGQWANEAFPAAESAEAAKAIAADANKGKSIWGDHGKDGWTWSIGNRNFVTRTPENAHKAGLSTDWQYMETLKNTGGSPYKGFKGALNAAAPGARGATPIYDKKTDKTNWFYKPTPQQRHPHLKEKGHAYSDGGKVGPLRSGRPYSGVFSKPVTPIPIMESVKAHLEKPAAGIQNIIDNAPKARVVAPNALSIAPKFMGPLGTLAAVLNPTQAAVATRDPVDAAPMGLEAEMFKRQAAIDAAKPSIWERYKSGDIPYTIPSIWERYKSGDIPYTIPSIWPKYKRGDIPYTIPSIWPKYKRGDIPYTIPSIVKGSKAEIPTAAQDMIDSNQTSNEIQHDTRIGPLNYDYSYDKNLWDNVVERGKEGVKDVGTWVMPKVIDRVEGLMNLLGPLAPKEKRPVYQVPIVYET